MNEEQIHAHDTVMNKVSLAIAHNSREIDLRSMGLESIPIQLFKLNHFHSINLSENKLKNLQKQLAQLTNLKELRLNRNQLNELPAEIGQLSNLRILDLRNNNLKSLPTEILNLSNLETLLLHENQLDIPAEILGISNALQNRNAKKIIAYYRDSQNEKRTQLNEIKMLVVGQAEVGKSSIIQQLVNGQFLADSNTTHGIDIHYLDLPLKERYIKFNIWDFGGQEVMHATHQFFLTQRSIYVLVLGARSDLETNKLIYWLDLIEQYGGDEAPIILVINKIDDNPILNLNEVAFRRKYNVKEILRTSCKTGDGIRELNTAIFREVKRLPHITDSIPKTWLNVKKALEAEKKKQDIIEFDSFVKLCDEQSIQKESRATLLGLLHDLGTVINYYKNRDNPVFGELQILNPEWVTDGVYAIINSEDIFEERGVLARSEVGKILIDERYRGYLKQEFILGMMEQFELAFPFENRQKYLIPDLLPESEPFVDGFNLDTLYFEYRYPNLIPPSVFSRFVVRQHEKIVDQEKELWKNGVVIYFDGLRALVREEELSRKVTIAIEGDPNRRREVLAIIRSTFDAIHESFAKLKVRAMVPIPGEEDAAVSYKALLRHEREGEPKIYVEDLDDFVEVSPLLSGVDGPKSGRDLLGKLENLGYEDIKTVLFKMKIDSEDFLGYDGGKATFVRETVSYLERRELVDKFVYVFRETHPDIHI